MSADLRLKGFIDRVLRLKEEQDTLAGDVREVYAEAKAEGYDKTAMGDLVSHLRKVEKKGADAVAEKQTVFDLYLDAYQRASGTPVATHTHAPDPKLIQTVVTGMQTEIGRKALVTALDIMIEREDGNEYAAAKGAANETARKTAGMPVADNRDKDRGFSVGGPLHSPQPSAPEGDSPPAQSSGAAPFINPRCQHSDTCHFADSREACHECLMAWAQRPRDEQRRLWAEANEIVGA